MTAIESAPDSGLDFGAFSASSLDRAVCALRLTLRVSTQVPGRFRFGSHFLIHSQLEFDLMNVHLMPTCTGTNSTFYLPTILNDGCPFE
jgi:hypothetical protein